MGKIIGIDLGTTNSCVSVEHIIASTEAHLIIDGDIPEMEID